MKTQPIQKKTKVTPKVVVQDTSLKDIVRELGVLGTNYLELKNEVFDVKEELLTFENRLKSIEFSNQRLAEIEQEVNMKIERTKRADTLERLLKEMGRLSMDKTIPTKLIQEIKLIKKCFQIFT